MYNLTIIASTSEEAEFMLKIIERYARHYYNVYGVHRVNTHQFRTSCVIKCNIESYIWRYIGSAAIASIMHLLGKATYWHKRQGTNNITIATYEVS